jgi:hypothetical protein
VTALDQAFAKVEASVGKISDIIKTTNPTPVTDVVVTSVVTDPAPTPPEVPVTPVTPSVVTPGGEAAAAAITDAVSEVAEEVSAE